MENIEDAVCRHCHKVIRTVPKHYCPRSPNQMHEPVESQSGTAGSIPASVNQLTEPPEPSEIEAIDITPRGMTTPEGNRRVNEASAECDTATRSLASACALFLDEYEMALIEMVGKESHASPSIRDDWHQINALLGTYRRRQDAFLRAVAGAPPPLVP